MSNFTAVESRIRQNAYKDAKNRIVALKEQFRIKAGAAYSPAMQKEMRYLEGMIDCVSFKFQSANFRNSVLRDIEDLRRQVAMLPKPSDTLPPRTSSNSAPVSGALRSDAPLPTFDEEADPVDAVAEFLMPDMPDDERTDEVRLLAMQGQLAGELSKFTTISLCDFGDSFVLGSWTSTFLVTSASSDDETKAGLLHLSNEAATLTGIMRTVKQHVEKQAEAIDQIEADHAEASANMQQAVQSLIETRKLRASRVAWLLPGLGVVALGGTIGTLTGGPIGLGAGLAVSGASAVSLQTYQAWVVQCLSKQIAQAKDWISLPSRDVARACEVGLQAEQRFEKKLDTSGSWTRFASAKGFFTGLPVWKAPSAIRYDHGHAFSTKFNVPLPANSAFRVLEQLRLDGSLCPGAQAVLSHPIDEKGTSLRYYVFSNGFINRDFLTVCVSRRRDMPSHSKSSFPTGSRPADLWDDEPKGSECYSCVVTSLPLELEQQVKSCGRSGKRSSKSSAVQGKIDIVGIRILELEPGKSQIDIVVDVDPKLTFAQDKRVRLNMLSIAIRFKKQLCLGARDKTWQSDSQ